jgi:hypothetical protein
MQAPADRERRSLRYIRLAAFLAGRPADVTELGLSLDEIESLVGKALPDNCRFPSWWRNDPRRMHARAWLTAGWRVAEVDTEARRVVFARSTDPDTDTGLVL